MVVNSNSRVCRVNRNSKTGKFKASHVPRRRMEERCWQIGGKCSRSLEQLGEKCKTRNVVWELARFRKFRQLGKLPGTGRRGNFDRRLETPCSHRCAEARFPRRRGCERRRERVRFLNSSLARGKEKTVARLRPRPRRPRGRAHGEAPRVRDDSTRRRTLHRYLSITSAFRHPRRYSPVPLVSPPFSQILYPSVAAPLIRTADT